MSSRALLAILLIITFGREGLSQDPRGAVVTADESPWVVSVVHAIDVDKMLARLREQQRQRVGVRGSAPQFIYNVTTGLVADSEGHVLTRLVSLDPTEKDHVISVVTKGGRFHKARLVGIDCATGFAVLFVESLDIAPPPEADSQALSEGASVRIISTDVSEAPVIDRSTNRLYIKPSLRESIGRIADDSIYSRARGARNLLSRTLLSRSDSSIVTDQNNRVVGMAQYAGFGRAYLFTIDKLRETVAKRVIEMRDNVPAGWLGATGINISQLQDSEILSLGLQTRAGVMVREVTPESPAATYGIQANDVIVGLDDLDVMGTADLAAMLSSSPAGREVRLRTLRDGRPMELAVVLGAKAISSQAMAPLGPQQYLDPLRSQRSELVNRIDELGTQYRTYLGLTPTKENTEALRELEIEIRQLQDILRGLDQQGLSPENVARDLVVAAPAGEAADATDTTFALGFTARDLTAQLAVYLGATGGVLITRIVPGSPAERAGLKAGDVIVAAGDDQALSGDKLRDVLESPSSIILTVVRNKQPIEIVVEDR